MLDEHLRKIICYHYRRAGRDPDLREFIVVLEKDGRLVKVGEVLNFEGTFHKPRQIFELIEKHGLFWSILASDGVGMRTDT
jgi:hypothetical protein